MILVNTERKQRAAENSQVRAQKVAVAEAHEVGLETIAALEQSMIAGKISRNKDVRTPGIARSVKEDKGKPEV